MFSLISANFNVNSTSFYDIDTLGRKYFFEIVELSMR